MTTGLTTDGCRARQRALREHLDRNQLDAALIGDRRHVHYLTGYWCPAVFASVALLEHDGPTTLVTPHRLDFVPAADVTLHYPAQRRATLIDDQPGAAVEMIAESLRRCERVGVDGPVLPWAHPSAAWADLRPALLTMRRHKNADEVELLWRAIAATEAAYAYAFKALRPGVTEVELFAGMQAAAAEYASEVLGEFGNDFQVGSPGGPPRRRPAQAGEVAVFDLSVTLRGYRSDMCRSFVVGRLPSTEQTDARERILAVLRYVERTAQPGVSCRQLYADAATQLEGYRGWSFPHHLGHGIGLSAHEAPRLNPEWDDTFQVGDVFTAEPGLYGPDLRAGLRIEEIYHLTETGLEKLTTFPTELS
ncbi:MAG TPA: Xaa-Pro peptidase family protein [Fimbriiglobus sp.]|nr:Xaa-Pro peptidase family protein [Fimbriiglobus sp.]